MVERAILQRGYDNQSADNESRVHFEMDSDQTMVSESEEDSDFIFDQTIEGINVDSSTRNPNVQLTEIVCSKNLFTE